MTKQDTSKQTPSDTAPAFDGYDSKRLNSNKLTVDIGGKMSAVYQGTGTMMVNPSTEDIASGKAQPGEKKEMNIVRFEDPKTKEPCHINGDAGLMSTIEASGVKEGQLIGLVRNEKIKMKGGRSVNNWDLYKLTPRA
jgi:hypothetical protein